jgi:DNA-binding transcriptional MocR family regulator
MSLGHREGLVRIARQFDALVVTDDVYDFLQWPSSPSSGSSTQAQSLSQAYVPRIVDVDRRDPFRFHTRCS